MTKGTIALLLIAAVIWGFWMTKEWLKNPNKNINKSNTKSNMKSFLFFIIACFTLTSCTSVDSGHKGVEVSWGGETNLQTIYPEGMVSGFHWIFDDMIEYDVREHTIVKSYEFNDKNDMKVAVTLALDFNLDPTKVNLIHSKINNIDTKIETSLSAAAKIVVPQFSAVDLNKHQRQVAERALDSILSEELPEFYTEYKRIRITDVNIPEGISQLAEQTAVQIGRNELAQKKEAEQVALAKAKVAEADGNYQAGILNAKTKDIMSQPKMLEMMRVENESKMWDGFVAHGNSPYGSNNVFGAETAIIRGLK